MRVWKVLTEEEENAYMTSRERSPRKDLMRKGEVYTDGDDARRYIHHIDDNDRWINQGVLHPEFEKVVGKKPNEDAWTCDHNHEYTSCKCHLELVEFGEDESV